MTVVTTVSRLGAIPYFWLAQDFYRNFSEDPKVKIPWVRRDLSGPRVLTMEWIDGIRCTDPVSIHASGMDVAEFIRCGVVTGLRQLLEVSISCCQRVGQELDSPPGYAPALDPS